MVDPRIERRGWEYWERLSCDQCSHLGVEHMDEGGSLISCDAGERILIESWSGKQSIINNKCKCKAFTKSF